MHRIEQWEIRDALARPMSLPAASVLRVTAGRVWLTQEHGGDDIWLLPGEEWRATQPVRVWLSAEPTATLQRLTLETGRPPVPAHGQARTMQHALRMLLGYAV
jgi:hypothetical protein